MYFAFCISDFAFRSLYFVLRLLFWFCILRFVFRFSDSDYVFCSLYFAFCISEFGICISKTAKRSDGLTAGNIRNTNIRLDATFRRKESFKSWVVIALRYDRSFCRSWGKYSLNKVKFWRKTFWRNIILYDVKVKTNKWIQLLASVEFENCQR